VVIPTTSNSGEANANSGIAIRLLSDADRTMNALFEHNVERYIEDIARMRILFASHYVREKRAWGLDGSDNPTERLSGLEALRRGAGVVVRVVESSGTPRTPEVMDEQILAFFDRGALGDPKDPAVRKMLFKALQSPAAVRVSEMLEQMEAAAMEAAAMAPPPPPGMEAPPAGMDETMPPEVDPMAPMMPPGMDLGSQPPPEMGPTAPPPPPEALLALLASAGAPAPPAL
jgi:hypothetical protein